MLLYTKKSQVILLTLVRMILDTDVHTVHFSVYVFQVVTLRVVHEKLLCLLPGAKQQALTVERVFEPFSGLNPLHYNPYTEVRYKELHVALYLVSVICMQLLLIVVDRVVAV